MIRISTFFLLLLTSIVGFAQIPSGYYTSVDGKKAAELKSAFASIIRTHTERTYNNLWTDFQTTDKRADGKVWDIYSNATNYVFSTNQCGNYSVEGDCYNREHSFPKSWFNDGTPMYSDLFHLYPSDGKVNGMRSNYPFGEVGTATYTSKNGYCKLGSCSFSGYSGTVFEPNDELKGDMARTYMYMVTSYEANISTWSSEHLAGNKYPGLNSWSISLFLKWSRQDPVSQKEINRNNAVYGIQNNRNPFIDFPELAEYIWGTKMDVAFSTTTGVSENLVTPTIYYSNQSVFVDDFESEGLLSIYDLQGKLLLKANIFSGDNRIEVKLEGAAIAVISSNKGVYSKKILAQN